MGLFANVIDSNQQRRLGCNYGKTIKSLSWLQTLLVLPLFFFFFALQQNLLSSSGRALPPFCCRGKESQTSRASRTAKKKLWLIVCASSPTLLTSAAWVPGDRPDPGLAEPQEPRERHPRGSPPAVSTVPAPIFICPLAPDARSWGGSRGGCAWRNALKPQSSGWGSAVTWCRQQSLVLLPSEGQWHGFLLLFCPLFGLVEVIWVFLAGRELQACSRAAALELQGAGGWVGGEQG